MPFSLRAALFALLPSSHLRYLRHLRILPPDGRTGRYIAGQAGRRTLVGMAGQTLAEIRTLLNAAGLSPRHRFGQNFLIDLNLMRKIVAAAQLGAGDVVLEVGPGTGSLTELLLDTGCRVVAVEIDRDLHRLLAARLGDHPRLTQLCGDALAGKHALHPALLDALHAQRPAPEGAYKLVANLPYQIATPLIMELLYGRPRFASLTCTIQKEVAERVLSPPGRSSYGPVSVVAQTLAEVRRVASLPPEVFWPQPKVASLAIQLALRDDAPVPEPQWPEFVRLVRTAFMQRRKMLRSALKPLGIRALSDKLAACGISPDARAEMVSPQLWQSLQRALSARR